MKILKYFWNFVISKRGSFGQISTQKKNKIHGKGARVCFAKHTLNKHSLGWAWGPGLTHSFFFFSFDLFWKNGKVVPNNLLDGEELWRFFASGLIIWGNLLDWWKIQRFGFWNTQRFFRNGLIVMGDLPRWKMKMWKNIKIF